MSVKSPCIGVCEIAAAGPAKGLCHGCLRSLEEIAGWGSASEALREAILEKVVERRREVRAAKAAGRRMEEA